MIFCIPYKVTCITVCSVSGTGDTIFPVGKNKMGLLDEGDLLFMTLVVVGEVFKEAVN